VDKEKKLFSETRVYPVVFMIIVALLFGTILAVFYHSTIERVELSEELRFKQSVLSLFSLPFDDVIESYEKHIIEQEKDGYKYYVAYSDEEKIGYCFIVHGAGLWGSITCLVGVDPEFDQLIAIHILNQSETPGLGGRISEPTFQEQFAGKPIFEGEEVINYRLVPEKDAAKETEINQITGATASSKAIVDMLTDNLKKIIEILGDQI